jgi:hypothetical protein
MYSKNFISARRPLHASAAQHMQMEMLDALSALRTDIRHEAEASFVNVELFGELVCDFDHMKPQLTVILFELCDRTNMLLGDDENMRRRLRRYVEKSENGIVLIRFLAGYFTGNNLTEQTVFHSALLSL